MFKDKLKTLRKHATMSQQQVADLLGVDRSTYTGYETSKAIPSIDKVKSLARIFNVTVDSLLSDDKPIQSAKSSVDLTFKTGEGFAPYNNKTAVDMTLANLTNEEKMLIGRFRLISDDDKQAVLLDVEEKASKVTF